MNLLQAVTAFFTFGILVLYEFVVVTLLVVNFPQTGSRNMTSAPLIIIGFVLLGLFGMLAILIGARIVYRKLGEEEWF